MKKVTTEAFRIRYEHIEKKPGKSGLRFGVFTTPDDARIALKELRDASEYDDYNLSIVKIVNTEEELESYGPTDLLIY